MPTKRLTPCFLASLLLLGGYAPATACTSILVTKGASADGSVIITYSCDLLGLYNELPLVPAADHKPGEMIDIPPRDAKDKRHPARFRRRRIPTRCSAT